ncbi:MAG: hypothetical protein K2P41_06370 [Lachnospiraceae bacterium]|nr:hypothetical protein [Lachnospiraceae bacterium]
MCKTTVDNFGAGPYNQNNQRNQRARGVTDRATYEESRRRWDCGREPGGEWTCEGGTNGASA